MKTGKVTAEKESNTVRAYEESSVLLGSGRKGHSYVGKKGPQTAGKKRPLMVG